MKIYVKKKTNNCNINGDCFASLGSIFLCILFPEKKCPLFAVFLIPSLPHAVPAAIKHSTKIGAQTIIHNAAGYSFFPWPATAFSFPTLNTS